MPGPVAARKRSFAVHPRGVGDAAPYNVPQGFSLSQTGTAAWGRPPYIPLFHSP